MVSNSSLISGISVEVRKIYDDVVKYRRYFHKNPELSLKEFETASFIEKELKRMGYSPKRLIGTDVVAVLDSRKSGPTIMLRADMDALPVVEENSHSFVSCSRGVMHACGHDAHMAMLLGLASYFRKNGIPRGKIKFCFQPGEEGADGAGKMVEAGVLNSPKVNFAFGMHVWSPLPVGEVAVLSGPCMAAVDEFEVTVLGSGGHAAYPQTAVDPVFVSSMIIQSLQGIVSRNVNPLQPAVLTVSSIQAGNAFNVIPSQAVLKGTVRTFQKETRKLIKRRFKEIVEGVAKAHNCTAKISYFDKVPATINHPEMSDFVRKIAAKLFGSKNLRDVEPTMGGEDFSRYAEKVPAVFAWIGAGNEKLGAKYPHHHPKFNIDEISMLIGMELGKEVALTYLETH